MFYLQLTRVSKDGEKTKEFGPFSVREHAAKCGRQEITAGRAVKPRVKVRMKVIEREDDG